jgi:hypothetical protein
MTAESATNRRVQVTVCNRIRLPRPRSVSKSIKEVSTSRMYQFCDTQLTRAANYPCKKLGLNHCRCKNDKLVLLHRTMNREGGFKTLLK